MCIGEAETLNDRFQEKLLVSLNKTSFFDAKRAPEGLGGPKRRIEDRRGRRSTKRGHQESKSMVLFKEFNVCLGNIKSDPQNTNQSRHWRVACCRNWRSKKWICYCYCKIDFGGFIGNDRFYLGNGGGPRSAGTTIIQ